MAPPHGSRLYPRLMAQVSEHTAEIEQLPVFWRSAPGPVDSDGSAVALYLHGVPTNSDEWVAPREHHGTRPWWQRWWRRKRSDDTWVQPPPYPLGFLERTGGLAPDLPGFGRSGKPGNFDYSIPGYVRFLEQFLDMLSIEQVNLIMHDWGIVGLAFAQRHPERVKRLTIINAVPLLPGYRWHPVARAWRTPVLGELVMGSTTRHVLRLGSKKSNAAPGAMSESWLDSVLDHFDQGTQRAILRLYRSAPSDVLAKAGEHLGALSMPALVVWGAQDPYIPLSFAHDYCRALPNAQLLELPDAGHWPWLDRPDVVEQIVDFQATS
jgi:pimeloyl-ACP methyl ester carboxylesterase